MDDITHGAVSTSRALFVIARNSSFTYKGRAVDVNGSGANLGRATCWKAASRKAANQARITGQLVDAATGAHLLGKKRSDGGLGDIFNLQDQVTESVVGAIAPAVEKAEIERARRKPTESFSARLCPQLRGSEQGSMRLQAGKRTKRHYACSTAAIELRPIFLHLPDGRAAHRDAIARALGWICSSRRTRSPRRQGSLERAGRVGQGRPHSALASGGWALTVVVRDLEVGAGSIDRGALC